MTICEVIQERGIGEIVHFTSNHGLVGILEMGEVLSRRRLPEVKHLACLAAPTSAQRQEAMSYFNKQEDWLDFINLSISEINYYYFRVASTKWHVQGDRWWTILSFNPQIMTHDGVWFTTTNNVYEHVSRGQGLTGLNTLFGPTIRRKDNWYASRQARPAHLPTCQQAEVLYPKLLSLQFLQCIYVQSEEQCDLVSGWLRLYHRNNIRVIIQPNKFNGMPN